MSNPAPNAGDVPHMTPESFRKHATRAIDLIASYWESLERDAGAQSPAHPVLCPAKPGDLLKRLPGRAPERAGGDAEWSRIFADIESLILPSLTHWQSPNFYAYFPCNGSFPAIIGELLSAGLGVNGMLWATSPGATELETRLLDWMCRAMTLPDAFLSTSTNGGGCIQGTASESTLAAMLAARWRARARLRERGIASPELVAYTSTQAHSSVVKAAMIAGIAEGPDDPRVRLVPADHTGAMREDQLARLVQEDAASGRVPFYVCATVGTTGITAIDRVDRIARALDEVDAWRAAGGWLHVDAAHAGALMLCPEFAHLRAGLDRADSMCFNPHKWMLTTFDCDLFWTRDRGSLISSMSINPAYLRNQHSESGEVFDYRDWHVPLGRRFRALKLWFVLRHYGLEGIRAYLREHLRLAGLVESLAREDPLIELCGPRTMNLVVFRPRPPAGAAAGQSPEAQDARTRRVMETLNASGRLFLSPVVLPTEWSGAPEGHPVRELAGRLAIRMSIGATLVEESHVRGAWALVQQAVRDAATP